MREKFPRISAGPADGRRVGVRPRLDEAGARPGDPGADGADAAAADVGGLLVGEAQQLGEDERLAAVGAERGVGRRRDGPAHRFLRTGGVSMPLCVKPSGRNAHER